MAEFQRDAELARIDLGRLPVMLEHVLSEMGSAVHLACRCADPVNPNYPGNPPTIDDLEEARDRSITAVNDYIDVSNRFVSLLRDEMARVSTHIVNARGLLVPQEKPEE